MIFQIILYKIFYFFYVHFVGLRRMIRNVASQNKDGIKKKWIFVSSESETPNGIHDKNAKERIFFFFFLQKMNAKYAIVLHSIVQLYEQNKIQTRKICVNLSWTGDRIKLKELSSVIKRKEFRSSN